MYFKFKTRKIKLNTTKLDVAGNFKEIKRFPVYKKKILTSSINLPISLRSRVRYLEVHKCIGVKKAS